MVDTDNREVAARAGSNMVRLLQAGWTTYVAMGHETTGWRVVRSGDELCRLPCLHCTQHVRLLLVQLFEGHRVYILELPAGRCAMERKGRDRGKLGAR